ncbi:hypothetical protein D6850_17040 [Roseovarius spongiae]|uniref:Cytochrome C oxidase subunit I n=1 Tax=Roseovarius spongiae TaxID=2320272 RepID=A0A3A8B3Z0_9RHOB|nr:hypothetical protein [Roseovarius spongiae]RKF12664.1 hypothetical protein D6850_17040 [Roseovarius spongiae]
MAEEETRTETDIGHPAPGRHKVGDWLLVFSFLLAPTVWALQLAAIASLSGLACLAPGGEATGLTSLTWAGPAIRWINVAALVLGIAGTVLTMVNMRRSHQAADPPEGGAISAGEGRVHWMAFGGLFVALVSVVAIIANSIPIFWGGMCPV